MVLRWVTFALIGLACTEANSAQKRRGMAHRVAQPPPLSMDIPAINNPQQPDLPQGAKGSPVVRAQILLARAHFSCGEIDANFGSNLDKTVRAFQGDRHLPVTGVVDAATWAALNADSAPAITQTNIAEEDVEGPFAPIPTDLMEQAKLPALSFASPLEGLAEKFHANP